MDSLLGDKANKLVSTVVGGVIGGRADRLVAEATASSWSFFKNLRTQEPLLNHDLECACRGAYLLATLELVRQAKLRIEVSSTGSRLMTAGDDEALETIRKAIEADLRDVGNTLPTPLADAQLFLVDPQLAPAARLARLKETLRQNLVDDFSRWLSGNRIPVVIDDLLQRGWIIETSAGRDVSRDWYSLVAIAFTEKLKATPQLARLFESRLLAQIAAREPEAAAMGTFEGFQSKLEGMTVPLQRIEDSLGLLHGVVADIKTSVERFGEVSNQVLLKQNEVLAALHRIADLKEVQSLSAEPRDQLLSALASFAHSVDPRAAKVVEYFEALHFDKAQDTAFELAHDEEALASQLEDAASEARERAAGRWIEAGDIAFLGDHEKAAKAFEHAVKLAPFHLYGWSRLGQVLWWLDRLPEALSAFTQLWRRMPGGVDILVRATDPQAAEHWRMEFLRKHPDVSQEAYTWFARGIVVAGLNIVEVLRRKPELVSNWIITVGDSTGSGKRPPKKEEAAGIIDLMSERVHGLDGVLSKGAVQVEHRRTLEELALIANYRGQFDVAEGYLNRAREMSIEQADFVAEASYLNNLGIVAGRMGYYNTAETYLYQVLAICEGDPTQDRLIVSLNRVSPEEAQRRRDEARHGGPGEDEIEVSNRLRDDFNHDTESAFQKALKLKETEGYVHGNLAHVALALGDMKRADQEYRRMLEIHEKIGYVPGVAMALEEIGNLAHGSGDSKEARANWDRSRRLFGELGATDRAEALASRIRMISEVPPAQGYTA